MPATRLSALRVLVAVVCALSLWLFSGCAAPPAANPASAPRADAPIGPGATLIVQGLSCPLCASSVDKQLATVDGVRAVRVNLQTGEIEVDFADGARPTDAALARAVDDGGFTLVRIVPRS